MSELDPSASHGMPLYKEVKRQLLKSLSENEWAPGQAVPSETQLCLRYGISIGTLRKAVDELAAESILVRHQGRGTFVTTHNRHEQMFRFFHVVRQDGLKSYPVLQLVAFGRGKPDKPARMRLCMAPGARAIQFTNLHSQNGEPVMIDEITLPEAPFANLSEATLRHRPSTLYNLYQLEFGLNVIRIEERLRATQAGPGHAALLGIDAGAPLLQIQRTAFSYNDYPVESRLSFVNTQRYEYFPAVAR